MTLNPSIGHLYHDHNISNAYTVLDAREHLRTREINAREAKYLRRYSRILERAKNICQKRNEWEQSVIRKQLDSLKSRTISLDKGLREESERCKRQEDMAFRKSSSTYSSVSSRTSWKSRFSKWSVYSQCQPESGDSNLTCRVGHNSTLSPNSKTAKLNKRAEEITRSLHKLYTKNVERKWLDGSRFLREVLENESKAELKKALRVLKGTPAGHLIEAVLRERDDTELSHFMTSPEIPKQIESSTTSEIDQSGKLSQSQLALGAVLEEQIGPGEFLSPPFNHELRQSPQPLSQSESVAEKAECALVVRDSKVKEAHAREKLCNYKNAVLDVFERDDPRFMSSMVVNPSESDLQPRLKWTELFKPPELWQVHGEKPARQQIQKRSVALVTITGKHRRRILKR